MNLFHANKVFGYGISKLLFLFEKSKSSVRMKNKFHLNNHIGRLKATLLKQSES